MRPSVPIVQGITTIASGGFEPLAKGVDGTVSLGLDLKWQPKFGLVLDGSKRVDEIIVSALSWDVMGGVARRAWAPFWG